MEPELVSARFETPFGEPRVKWRVNAKPPTGEGHYYASAKAVFTWLRSGRARRAGDRNRYDWTARIEHL